MDPSVASGNDLAMQMQAAVHPQGEPTADELELINRQHALKPLGPADVYVFRLEISNDLEDAYHTRMDPETTLQNYVGDFKDGRSIVNSHDSGELPPGRSFDAFLERRGTEGDPADPARTSAVLKGYIPRGIRLGKVANDDLIRGIDAGVVKDGSVGFDQDARYVCSLCGGEMYEMDSTCAHLPGMTYSGKRAKALIVDAHANEASLVYDGATPKAMIDKARRMAAAGKLPAGAVGFVEKRYRVRLRGTVPVAGGKPRPPAELAEPDLDDLPGTPAGDDDHDADDRKKEAARMDPKQVTDRHAHGDLEHEHEHAEGDTHDHSDAEPDRYLELVEPHVRESVVFLGGGEPSLPELEAPWSQHLVAARARTVRDHKSVAWLGMTALERAVWTAAYMNDLPDSAFAYIEPGGEKDGDGKTAPRSLRHFPHHDAGGKLDEAHVRNALARIPQSGVGDAAKSSALSHVKAHAKTLGIEVEGAKSNKNASGGAMHELDPDTFASLAALAMKADDRARMVDALVRERPEEVTPSFVERVAAVIVKRAGPQLNADVASQVQGILDSMDDAHDAHMEAMGALKSLVGMGSEGGLQYGLPETMASIEDLEPGQAAAGATQQYGPSVLPGQGANGSAPENGILGRAAPSGGARSIEMGAIPMAEAVKAALGTIVGIIDDLMKVDAREDEQDVEAQAAESARPVSSEAIAMGRSREDHEARVRRVQEFERAIRLVPDLAPFRRLVEQARAGSRYRRVLVTEYLEWGVRARGERFNIALQRRLVPSYDLEALEQMTRELEDEAYRRFANATAEEHPEWMQSLAGRVGRQSVPGLLPGTPTQLGDGKVAAAKQAVDVGLFVARPS